MPPNWVRGQLGETLPISYGKALRSTERSDNGTIPVYGSNGVVGYHNDALTKGPTIVVGRKGAAGSIHYSSTPCWVIDTAYFSEKDVVVDLKFASFLLQALRLNSLDRSTAIPSLSRDDYSAVDVPIPPRDEQLRIVAKVEELFSDLDAGVAALERARANLKRYRAAVLKAAVEGKLTEQWRKEHPDVEPASKLLERILAERRRKWEETQLAKYATVGKTPPNGWKDKYPEPATLDTTGLFDLPRGWTWVTLDALTEIVGGLTKGQKRRPHEKMRHVTYLRVANVQRGYLDLSEMKTIEATEAEITELKLKVGDVLFNEGGDRDKLGRGWIWNGEVDECVHQNHVFRARPVLENIQSKFISFHGNMFGKSWFLKHGKQSVNLASINMTVLRQFPVPLPPLMEQVEIVKEADDRLSVIDKATADLQLGLQRAAVLRQAILKRAFDGKLVPQDQNDEPASLMLERIRAARSASVPSSRNGRGKRIRAA